MTHEFLNIQRIGPYAVGEIPLPLVVTFKDSDGAVINLTGYNAETVIEGVDDTADLAPAGTTAVTNAAGGEVTYTWGESDFMTAGQYRLQMWVAIDASGSRVQLASDLFELFVRDGTSAPTGL